MAIDRRHEFTGPGSGHSTVLYPLLLAATTFHRWLKKGERKETFIPIDLLQNLPKRRNFRMALRHPQLLSLRRLYDRVPSPNQEVNKLLGKQLFLAWHGMASRNERFQRTRAKLLLSIEFLQTRTETFPGRPSRSPKILDIFL